MSLTSLTPLDWFKFADNAYVDPVTSVPEGWVVVSGIPKELSNPGNGYQAVVFENLETGEIIVSHRGSEFDEFTKDWITTDGALLTGALNNQFTNARKLTQYVRAMFPNAPIGQTGHSLGGWLAQMVGMANGQKAVSIDAPGALDQIRLMDYILAKDGFSGSCKNASEVITAFQSRMNPVNTNSFGEHIVEPIPLFDENARQKIMTLKSFKMYLASGYFHTRGYINKAFNTQTGLLKFNPSYNQQFINSQALSTAAAVASKVRNQVEPAEEVKLLPGTVKTSESIDKLVSVVYTYQPRV